MTWAGPEIRGMVKFFHACKINACPGFSILELDIICSCGVLYRDNSFMSLVALWPSVQTLSQIHKKVIPTTYKGQFKSGA